MNGNKESEERILVFYQVLRESKSETEKEITDPDMAKNSRTREKE